MPTFTQKFEDFLDNNHPGGYISTSTNISDSDLDARITQNVNNRGFLTSNSHLPWNQIDNKPTLFSGSYNDLTDKPSIPIITISDTLNTGTKIATITINGVNTHIYNGIDPNDIGNSGNSGIVEETDPVFLLSPAATITDNDITNWNNKSNFDGKYTSLDPTTLPAKNIQIFYINESDDVNFKYLTENTYCDTTDLYSSSSNFTIENILNNIITTYMSSFDSILKIHSFIGTFTILNINNRNNVYTFTLSNLVSSNFNSISQVNKTNNEILAEITTTNRAPVLIFDADNHILYIL